MEEERKGPQRKQQTYYYCVTNHFNNVVTL